MAQSAEILARLSSEGDFYRSEAIAFTLALSPAISSDGLEVIISLQQSVSLVDKPADRLMLRELFISNTNQFTLNDLRSRLLPIVQQAIDRYLASHAADDLLNQKPEIESIALKTMNQFGFSCGLEFLPPINATINCPALALKRATQRIELDRSQQLEQAGQLSDRIRNLGSANHLRADEQASLLPILMKSQPTRPIYLAAGGKVIQFDPETEQSSALAIDSTIGPLRSIRQSEDNSLLLGGQLGIGIYRAEEGTNTYPLSGTPSDHGINSTLIDAASNRLFGTHRQLGLLSWDLDTKQLRQSIASAQPLRNLINTAGSILLTAGNQLLKLQNEALTPIYEAQSPIIRLIPSSDSIWLIQENGSIDRLDPANPAHRIGGFERNLPLLAANLLEISGLSALLLSPASGPIQVISAAGQPLLELLGNYQGIRMLTASGRWFFGVSGDRQQLLGWDSSAPNSPCITLHITGRFGNRIADIC